jgi:outer membrane murein-binding lipoprotein Lpp
MHYEELHMNKLFIVAMAVAAVGLSACASNDTARVDQAPYAHERTVGASKAPATHSSTVFHARQSK